MKKFFNGKIVELIEEEENNFFKEIENLKDIQNISDKNRISALEKAIADLAILLMGGSLK